MAKKKRESKAAGFGEFGGFDMTPMIDVTFLLIIFFMLITELADVSKAKLKLPVAERAEPDDKHVPGRVVINVMKNGDLVIMGKSYSDKELHGLLAMEAKISREGSADGFPTRAILIRADFRAEFRHVEHAMSLCMYHKLWRIAFATKDPSFAGGG